MVCNVRSIVLVLGFLTVVKVRYGFSRLFSCFDKGCSDCTLLYYCNVCNDGLYLSDNECNRCGNLCKTCDDLNKCTSCNQGYYLDVITCRECPQLCYTCESETVCLTCNTGYYLKGSVCIQCPEHCTSCNSATNCTACTTGYHLYNTLCCPQACSTCRAPNQCTSCATGYVKNQGQCKQCPNGCASCGENNVCNSCKAEYRLMSGRCYTCPIDCATCIDDNMCIICSNPGYFVHNHVCVKCPEKCASCTSNTECSYCTKGVYGKNQCQQNCSASCKDRECDMNGRCKSCVDGMYGQLCDHKCSPTCLVPTLSPKCFDSNGTCVDGCTNGYYGERCEQRCSLNCVNETCERFTGTCLSTHDESSNESLIVNDIPEKDAIGVTTLIAIGAVITALIIVGVVIGVKATWKRRSHRRHDTHHGTVHLAPDVMLSSITNSNDTAKENTGANEYEQLDRETNLQETGRDVGYLTMDGATGQGSEYEQLKPRNADETTYSGLDVQEEDNVIDKTYENMKIK